jgi:hypothetical protein
VSDILYISNYVRTLMTFCFVLKSGDSSVGIALDYGLDDRGSRVRFPAGAGNFSLHHRVQNCSGAHPASYPMGTRGCFPGGKAAGSWTDRSPPSSAEVKEWVELYLSSPSTPPWRGAQLKHRDNLAFTFYLLYPWDINLMDHSGPYPVCRVGDMDITWS